MLPTPAASHARRRLGCSSAPSTAATTSHPMLCSPKCESARAPGSTPGRSASADWTATNAASSPRVTAIAAHPCAGGSERGRSPTSACWTAPAARRGRPCASRRSARASLRCRRSDCRSNANILARSRWRYTTPRPSAVVTVTPSTLHSRNHRESCVATLSCGRSWCAGSALVQVVQHPLRQPDRLAGGVLGSPTAPTAPDGGGSSRRRGQYHRVGVARADPLHLRQRRLQDREDVLGAGEEVVDRLVLDRDRRILKAQEVFQRRLQRLRTRPRTSPSQCRAATTNRLRRWK